MILHGNHGVKNKGDLSLKCDRMGTAEPELAGVEEPKLECKEVGTTFELKEEFGKVGKL